MASYELASDCLKQLEKKHDIDEKLKKNLFSANKVIEVKFSLNTSNKGYCTFKGLRCQHDDIRGPYKGGIRFHPNLTPKETKELASLMTWKTSLTGLPLGGAKGGIKFDPKEYSKDDIVKITRKYTQKISELIGPKKDIPAPDINTGPETMAIIMDEYSKIKNKNIPAIVTGKPPSIGGLEARKDATGYGISIAFKLLQNHFNEKIKETTVAIQGFGNVGKNAAKYIDGQGADVVCVSDSSGAVYDRKGLNIDDLIEFKKEKELNKYEKASIISNEELFTLDVDVLIPAAISDVIDEDVAKKIRTNSIIEAANGPITKRGIKTLRDKKIPVLPDIFANSGGVIASYLEWSQNLNQYRIKPREVRSEIKKRLSEVFEKLVNKKNYEKGIDFRLASYFHSLNNLSKAYQIRKNL